MSGYKILHARPLLSLFSSISVSYTPITFSRNGLLKHREFVSAVALTLFPPTCASMVPLPNATTTPYIWDTGYGVFNVVEVDHNALYPHVLLSLRDRIFGDDFFKVVLTKYEEVLRLRERTRPDEYIIVVPQVISAFSRADIIAEKMRFVTLSRRRDINEAIDENPIRGYENAIEVAKTLGVSCSIFRFRDFLKGLLLTRIGLAKYYEYNIFVNVLTEARNIARRVVEYADENEIPLLRVYIDAYTVIGDKHDAKSLMRCRIFDRFPAKIEAEGVCYHYVAPTYAITNGDTVTKHGVWFVYELEPSRIRYRPDNVVEYHDYVEVPKMLAGIGGRIRMDKIDTLISFRQFLQKRGRDFVIEKQNDKIAIKPAETKIQERELWAVERKRIYSYVTP